MLELRQAVLEQVVLRVNQLVSLVHLLFEKDWRRLVLQASHLEGFHNGVILRRYRAALAVRVKADDLDFTGLAAEFSICSPVLNLVLDRDLRARSQLLDKLASRLLGLNRSSEWCLLKVEILITSLS